VLLFLAMDILYRVITDVVEHHHAGCQVAQVFPGLPRRVKECTQASALGFVGDTGGEERRRGAKQAFPSKICESRNDRGLPGSIASFHKLTLHNSTDM